MFPRDSAFGGGDDAGRLRGVQVRAVLEEVAADEGRGDRRDGQSEGGMQQGCADVAVSHADHEVDAAGGVRAGSVAGVRPGDRIVLHRGAVLQAQHQNI